MSGNDSPQAGEPPGLTSTGLHLAVRTVGAAVVIAVEGELDLQTVPQLVDAVAAAEATDLTVVIDLSRVTFLGSAAMGVLVDLGARSGGPLGQRHVTGTACGRPGAGTVRVGGRWRSGTGGQYGLCVRPGTGRWFGRGR